ncbi:hypothetical protein H8E77_28160, partial [bacterium]|nr:hypothetical protein [bacterium]
MDHSQVLFNTGVIVLGYDYIWALAQPVINLGQGTSDNELDRVAFFAMVKELQPAFQPKVSVYVKNLVVAHLHRDGDQRIDALTVESLCPIDKELATGQVWNRSMLLVIVVEQVI